MYIYIYIYMYIYIYISLSLYIYIYIYVYIPGHTGDRPALRGLLPGEGPRGRRTTAAQSCDLPRPRGRVRAAGRRRQQLRRRGAPRDLDAAGPGAGPPRRALAGHNNEHANIHMIILLLLLMLLLLLILNIILRSTAGAPTRAPRSSSTCRWAAPPA